MAVTYQWRGAFTNAEVNALHAEAYQDLLSRVPGNPA